MFEKRIKGLIVVGSLALLIVAGRLVQLQVFQTEYYQKRTERSVILKPRALPFVRGSITDRNGEVLVSDEPCWDVRMDYDIIAAEFESQTELAPSLIKRFKRSHRYSQAQTDEEINQAFRDDLYQMWVQLTSFSLNEQPIHDTRLRDQAGDIHSSISRVRKIVAYRRGFDAPVMEEMIAQTILTGLSASQQIVARELFASFPWLHVVPSSVRKFQPDIYAFAHVLGRMGRVNTKVVEDDIHADDPFAKYKANEKLGITGVEWLGESILRGRRGQVTLDRDGNMVPDEDIEALNGSDVSLTIHAPLQRRMYQLLEQVVLDVPESSGGAIVILNVETREVLALVSYPGYDPNQFNKIYADLRDDTEHLPLRFRAVSNRYAPGSTIKPLICLGGLMYGVITLESRETCTGYMFEDFRDGWRCWKMHGTNQRKAHGSINVVEALSGSCNVFMFRLGEKLGIDRVCSLIDMIGIGRGSGIGLKEENFGINPTPSWLMTHKNAPVTRGSARLFAIGQGEVSMTPIQVANLMATYASGKYRPVRLMQQGEPTTVWSLPGDESHWRAIRRGMYGVVNDVNGTAYQHAHFVHDRYALVGKTGSATAYPWPTTYRIPFVDENGARSYAVVKAGARGRAIDRFERAYPNATYNPKEVEVSQRWPTTKPISGDNHSHAWFGGFLQSLDSYGNPDWSEQPKLAMAVLVEFGGSGGRTSGPLGKKIAGELIEMFGEELDVNAPMPISERFTPDVLDAVVGP